MNPLSNEHDGKSGKKSANRLSKDGKWRSFSRVPHVLQYTSSETDYARIKIKGKLVCQSLETNAWTTSQLKLVDFLQNQRTNSTRTDKPKVLFNEAVKLHSNRVHAGMNSS